MVAIAVDPFWTLALALLLDAALGRPAWLRRPINGVRNAILRLIDGIDARLNRPSRSPANLRTRGALTACVLVGLAYSFGVFLDGLLTGGGDLAKAALIATFFAQRGAFDEARRRLGASSATHNSGANDPHSLARQGVAALIVRLSEDVVGATFAYALLGLSGLFAYGVILLLAERLSPEVVAKRDFGAAANGAARLLLAFAVVPAALLIVFAAAFCPGGSPARAARTLWRGGGPRRDGRPGHALATAAGALDLSFEGRDGWIGKGRGRGTTGGDSPPQ